MDDGAMFFLSKDIVGTSPYYTAEQGGVSKKGCGQVIPAKLTSLPEMTLIQTEPKDTLI